MKVLITIGSMTEKKFTRLFTIIEELCEENILDGSQVTAQVGADGYQPKNFNAFSLIGDEAFKQLITEADLIITHAGTGTVISSLKKGKKVIIFPRMAKYDEHYDDHQLELAELFTRNHYACCAKNKAELIKCIEESNSFVPHPFVSNTSQMNKLVIGFVES